MPDNNALTEHEAIVPVRDISGGVNNFLFEGEIAENQSQEQEDMDISKPGIRRKRDGYALIANDTGDASRARIFNFNSDSSSEEMLMYSADQLYKWIGSGNWASIGTHPATDASMQGIQADNRFYFCTQSANVHSWDGATLTDEANTNTDPPRGDICAYMLGQMFIAGNGSDPNLIYYSNQADGTGLGSGKWNRTANNIKVNIGSGNVITALIPFRQSDIIVFTQSSIWNLNIADSTPANWSLTQVHSDIGCIARDTVATSGNDVLFMDQSGNIRSLVRTVEDKSAGINPIPLSQAINGHVEEFNSVELANSSAIAFERFYFLSVAFSGGSENNVAFVHDTVTKSWTGPWNSWGATNFVVSTVEGLPSSLYFGDSTANSQVFKYAKGTFNDNGVAISFKETSRKYDFGAPRVDKLFNNLEIIAKASGSAELLIECQIDDQGYISVGTMSLTGGGPTLPQTLPFFLGSSGIVKKIFPLDAILGPGRFLQWRITNSGLDEKVEIIMAELSGFIQNVDLGSPAQ